jgi:Zn-dependent protease with chaperone function
MVRILVCGAMLCGAVLAHAAPVAPVVPAGAEASDHFDVKTATDAWLATVAGQARKNSDAYFEGGYWLMLWDFLATVAVMILLLETKASARMRDLAERMTRLKFFQYWIYFIEFILAAGILTFPLSVYEGWIREGHYGLSNQRFGAWFSDQMITLGLLLALGGLAFCVLIVIVKRLPRTWPLWGAIGALLFVTIGAVIAPVFIAPLFNKYKPLENQLIKNQILSMARANGIPAHDVYEVDASRQSKRVSANVSGLFGTDRITLNDNLLERCSPQAIMAVMGHEMGHYVMHHIYNGLMFAAIGIVVMFSLLRWGLDRLVGKFGQRWRLQSTTDLAAVPLAVLILITFSFVLTPIQNSYTRMQEYEADIYGLNASRQPDGEAEVDLLLGEYRKLDPSALEEAVFFDHPSGRTRITAAMRWKAENLCLFDATLACGSAAVVRESSSK